MDPETISTNTSLEDKTDDFCNNPTRDSLAEGLMSIVKPAIDQLDERIKTTRLSQLELKQQLEGLSEDLKDISVEKSCPVDLEEYSNKLMNARHKITVVGNILQATQVYEPSEDTFLLLDALENDLSLVASSSPAVVLEIGPGSGVVITAVAQILTAAFCLAIDINPFAANTTKKTSEFNKTRVDVTVGDLTTPLSLRNAVDLLIFNPPYVPSSDGEETELIDKAWAGLAHGRSTTDRLFPELPSLMSSKCLGYIVVIEENHPDEMADRLRSLGFLCDFVAKRNVRGERLRILRFSRGLTM